MIPAPPGRASTAPTSVRPQNLVWRPGRFSLSWPRRTLVVGAGLLAILLAGSVFLLGYGRFPVAPGDVVATLLGNPPDATTAYIVTGRRLPRLLAAILVGALLGTAGAVFQSVSRNALGSPDVIGFDSGAALGAVLVITATGGAHVLGVTGGALLGGLVTAVAVYALSASRGSFSLRLILVGIGLGALCASVTGYLLLRADDDQLASAAQWSTGSLAWVDEPRIVVAAVVLVLAGGAVLGLTPKLLLLESGDEIARTLGSSPVRIRAVALLAGTALTATATAVAGPIGFVALAAPQVARRLTRAPGPGPVPAALTGAVVLLLADTLAQNLFEVPVPVGLVTVVVGGLYLGWLLLREREVA